MNKKINDNLPPPPPRLAHKLIAVCAVALVVAGSWAKPGAKQSPLFNLEQIDHYNSLTTSGVEPYPANNPAVEYDRLATPEIIPAARIRNSPGTLRLKWSTLLLPAFSGYVKVHGARYRYQKRVTNVPYYFVEVPVTFDSTPIPFTIAPNSTSAPIEIPLGNLPNYVVGGELQLKLEVRGNIGTQLPGEPDSLAWGNKDVWYDFGKVYLTAQHPVNIQEEPWIEVLEQACWFAQEKSVESSIRREVCKGIFFETKNYNPDKPIFVDPSGNYDLDLNLTHYFNPNTFEMDCKDASAINVVMCESLGLPTQVRYYFGIYNPAKPEYTYYLKTNDFCGAGSNPLDLSNYDNDEFSHHCVAESGGLVYDSAAAQKYDLSGVLWLGPVWSWPSQSFPDSGNYGFVSWPSSYPFATASFERDVTGIQ